MSTRTISFQNLHPNILGIDVIRDGRLRLSQWSGVPADKLPLGALSTEILNYIDDRITALGGGGGGLADAVNYNGSVTTSGTANVISQAVTGWKLRGFHVHGNGDADITLTYTVSGSTKTIKCSIDRTTPQFDVVLPNPIDVDDSTPVYLSVTNTSGASADYDGVIFGE